MIMMMVVVMVMVMMVMMMTFVTHCYVCMVYFSRIIVYICHT